MALTPRRPVALIIDDDVGFLFWIGEIFVRAGWNIVPALNCRQALSLAVVWDSFIDLIIVNPALNGISEMVQTLSCVHRPRIVVIHDPDVEADVLGDATIDRPDLSTASSRAEGAERVRRLLREFKQ